MATRKQMRKRRSNTTRKGGKKQQKHSRRSSVSRKHKSKVSRKHGRKHRSHTTKKMRGGSSAGQVRYVPSNADFTGVREVVPYKVGLGISPSENASVTGRNHYTLSPDFHAPNGEIMNTSLHMSLPDKSSQVGGGITDLMPQDLVNLGRSIIGNAETLYDNWVGAVPPMSSNVMVQPINTDVRPTLEPVNMNKVMKRADHLAASFK